MKYIRTKDGIYEENKVPCLRCKYFAGSFFEEGCQGKTSICVFPQADTIEELCDEIVIRRNEKPYYSNSPIGKSKSWKAYQPLVKEIKDIYGAIWTDKGLIYVAKMNDKGELELL